MQPQNIGPKSHLVLGTAGHIDHGKTSLVKALTGIDTDRLKEEQERGITIELGFAHLKLVDGPTVAVIDVPGHERFVRTMVAGAVGIDAVLFVVAADEGVMPQTREHLDICELLGLMSGVVALTKSDLVDDELRELSQLELRETLRGTFLENAPIIPCSVRTGAGLDALLAAIGDLLARLPGRDAEGVTRLPIDRVFALRGFGTVATGTLFSGRLTIGDELLALPSEVIGHGHGPAKVRGLHVHGQAVNQAVAGQRVAVNLAAPREAASRGDTLVRAAPPLPILQPSQLIDVELRYLKSARSALGRRSQLIFHAAAAQRLCAVTLLDGDELLPGQRALAQLQLDQPLLLLPGDRFVLRGFTAQENHGTTIGGGVVLRTLAKRQRRGTAPLLATLGELSPTLAALHSPEKRETATARLIELEAERQGAAGTSLGGLRQAVPIGEAALRAGVHKLCAMEQLIAVGNLAPSEEVLYVSRAAVKKVRESLLGVLGAHHEKEPRSPGLSRETLRTKVAVAPRLFQHLLDGLVASGIVVLNVERDELRLGSHKVLSDDADRALLERVTTFYRNAGLGPPRLEELPELLIATSGKSEPRVSPVALRAAVETLVRGGVLLRLKDLLFLREHVDELRQRLIRYLQKQRELTPSAWKDLVGQSRKYSIPLAEHFDAEKLTLRVGDVRRLR